MKDMTLHTTYAVIMTLPLISIEWVSLTLEILPRAAWFDVYTP
jgi:hypothetical protein